MMKRNYVTPMIAVEYYELTQSIAACVKRFNSLDAACIVDDEDATDPMRDLAWDGWFIAGSCTVNEIPTGMGAEDGFCYHTNANAAFVS